MIAGKAFSLLSSRSAQGESIVLAYPVDISVIGTDSRKLHKLTIDSIGQFGYAEFALKDSNAGLLVTAPHAMVDIAAFNIFIKNAHIIFRIIGFSLFKGQNPPKPHQKVSGDCF